MGVRSGRYESERKNKREKRRTASMLAHLSLVPQRMSKAANGVARTRVGSHSRRSRYTKRAAIQIRLASQTALSQIRSMTMTLTLTDRQTLRTRARARARPFAGPTA